MAVGILITTLGILLLVLGLVGASIEVYSQLLSAIVEQQVSAITQQMPSILQPEGANTGGETGAPFDSADILRSLIENLITTPLWLTLAVVGILLLYIGLYITQRQRPRYRP